MRLPSYVIWDNALSVLSVSQFYDEAEGQKEEEIKCKTYKLQFIHDHGQKT
jgi:hypothetical protein